MRQSVIVALLCPRLLAGCTKPVTYYAEHASERHARIEHCLVSPENDSQDCRNAAQAEFDALGIKAVNGEPLCQRVIQTERDRSAYLEHRRAPRQFEDIALSVLASFKGARYPAPMPRDGAMTLSDANPADAGADLRAVRTPRGRYNVARLMAKLGAAKLPALAQDLADYPRARACQSALKRDPRFGVRPWR
jgi:hypothetical protein